MKLPAQLQCTVSEMETDNFAVNVIYTSDWKAGTGESEPDRLGKVVHPQ